MSLARTTWHIQADEDWRKLAPIDPEAILNVNPGDVFHAKQGRSIARWKLSDGLIVFLKRHYGESFWRGWVAALTGSPSWSAARQEYDRLRRASTEGFVVPRAVAVGVSIGPTGRLRGFLAVEELKGMKPLHELIPQAFSQLPATRFSSWKRGLVGELARIARTLHARKYFHKDLYLCHFFAAERSVSFPPPDWIRQLAMIDLHRFARHPVTWRWWQLKDLAQLLYSTDIPGVTPRDRLRFWRLYAGPGRRSFIGRLVRKFVLVRWNNYRGHNKLRRAA